MTEFGVNVDPRHGYSPVDIVLPGGAPWVRSVRHAGLDMAPWLQAVRDAGGKNCLIYTTGESFVRGTYRSQFAQDMAEFGYLVDAWQAENELDLDFISWPRSRIRSFLWAARAGLGPDAFIIAPAAASGDPSRYNADDFRWYCNALAVHPYGQRVNDFPSPDWGFNEVGNLLDIYQHFGLPIWVTEFGGQTHDYSGGVFVSESERAQYHSQMMLRLYELQVSTAMEFCWSDQMVDGFGLVDLAGNAKETYAAFYHAAERLYYRDGAFADLRGKLPVRAGYDSADPYAQWGSHAKDLFVVHYTAGSSYSTTHAVAAYQTGNNAQEEFPGIAYHWCIEADGVPRLCHNLDRRTWGSGAYGVNARAVHCVYTGNQYPSDRQLDGIRLALRLSARMLDSGLSLEGHKDRYPTICPGPTWNHWKNLI